ncbi:ATP synthase F1 subunit delta [Penaeicola halotolerans]|uniref:ATP synthase F1 subunit delta n=1 Tax=Penaeicola halotolerans TaxID=2793196 RepID=UPI001CF87D85|nr:ATP synthase F1 subunit delta [Penaeicola halotolerans]
MTSTQVASRYAKSLLGLALERGVLEEVNRDMQFFSSTCKLNPDFVLMLKNPIINHSKKLSILKAIFADKVDQLTFSFFEIITRKNRESDLPAIATEFHHQYNVQSNVQEATITTTFVLTQELREKFRSIVKEISGKEVELLEKVNPDLIGGYILKVGDRQIDESISSHLKALRVEFGTNLYEKKY